MTRRRMLIGLVVLVLLATAGTWRYLRWRARGADTVVTLYGNVDIREAEPAFDDTGAVTQMLVDEGARLHKGELIARIDDRRYAARLAQAQQQARNLAAVLARLMHGSRPQEIAQARATMRSLQAVYANDRILFDRTAGLVPQGVASTEDLDNARARLRASRENFEAAKQAYVLAVKGPRAEDIVAARHAYEAALAAVSLAQREFDDTRLVAPADGVVEDRILEPGDMASPATPVYTIALTEPLWVRAYVTETDLGKLRLGAPATVTTDSFPGKRYRGWIGDISPTAEFTPKSVETTELRTRLVYQVRVFVCNAHGELRLGMPATVTVDWAAPRPTGTTRPPDCGAVHDGRSAG